MKPQHHILLGCSLAIACTSPLLAATPATATAASTSTVAGVWRTIDDKSGLAKSLVKIERASDGSYGGTIIKIIRQPGDKPLTICHDCPAPFTGKPILGLHVLWGLKADAANSGAYDGGKLLDPTTGQTYSGKATLINGGKKLDLRGYIGISLIGRSQTWVREQ